MKKLLGPSFVLASAALLAGCAGEDEQPEQQSASGFTEAPQTITTKTAALPIQSDFDDMRSAVDAERDIAFVGSAHGTKVSALRLATRQHLWQLTLDGDVDQVFFAASAERLYVSTATTLYVLEPMTGAVLHSAVIGSPVVTITYLPARNSAAQDRLIIGQRGNSSDWLLSALNPDTLAAVASTTLPAVDEEPKLQITAGAGLIWTMNYQGQRLYTIRPYLLMGDAIYPIDDHQVVDSVRDTGLMISPDSEWLITGGNNLLSTALDSEAQEYFEGVSRGFDDFSPTVTGGGVYTGPGIELMVRDDLIAGADTNEREVPYFNRFSVRQVLSTVSGVYALGHDHELGQALQWVTSNRADLPSIANPYTLSADQAFVPFDGEESHQQAELYLTVKLSAGDGSATVQPVCYEPCTYANALEVPLLEEAQQAHIDIHQLTDGPIAGMIVTASGDVQIGQSKWTFTTPYACQEMPSSGGNQFTGSVEATSIDSYFDSCGDEERIYNFSGSICAVELTDCQTQLQLGELGCYADLIVDGNFGEGGTSQPLPITEQTNNSSSSSSSSTPIYGEIGQETRSSSSERQPNDITGTINVHTDYLDDLSFQSSKSTCF